VNGAKQAGHGSGRQINRGCFGTSFAGHPSGYGDQIAEVRGCGDKQDIDRRSVWNFQDHPLVFLALIERLESDLECLQWVKIRSKQVQIF
jgi:hypothetical protein